MCKYILEVVSYSLYFLLLHYSEAWIDIKGWSQAMYLFIRISPCGQISALSGGNIRQKWQICKHTSHHTVTHCELVDQLFLAKTFGVD